MTVLTPEGTPAAPAAPRPVPSLGEGRSTGVRTAPVVLAPPRRWHPPARLVDVAVSGTALVVLLVVSALAGRWLAVGAPHLLGDRMLPWILSRGTGVAALLSLTALTGTGLWLRHPWRGRLRRRSPEPVLRTHVTLAAATVTLLAAHVTAVALDGYAGVGWGGAFLPWGAHYRPTGVALGTLALYACLLVGGTAALAGRVGRAGWFPLHAVSAVVFCLSVAHGILTGSDGPGLRWLYVACGAVVTVLQVSRLAARRTVDVLAAAPS